MAAPASTVVDNARHFWLEKGWRVVDHELVACRVADVESFLSCSVDESKVLGPALALPFQKHGSAGTE